MKSTLGPFLLHRSPLPLLCTALICGFACTPAHAAEIEVETDPNYELFTTLAYLAGYTEFNRNSNAAYQQAIDDHFGPHRRHRAVKTTKKLGKKNLVGYNAFSSLAAHVHDDLTLRVPLEPFPKALDSRWQDIEATMQFLELAARFAEETDFDEFWTAQAPYVDAVEGRFRDAFADKDIVAWFDENLQTPQGSSFRIVPGLLNGPNNYGSSRVEADGSVSYRSSIGLWHLDEQGLPSPARGVEMVVVHEFGHAFGNARVIANQAVLAETAEALYQHNSELMKRQAYGDPMIVMGETFTRAFTVLYAGDRYGTKARNAQLALEESAGFLWTRDLVQVLEDHRAEGPIDLDGLMPDASRSFSAWLAEGPERAFEGNINASVYQIMDANSAVMVVSDADSTGAKYGTMVHDYGWKKSGTQLLKASEYDPGSDLPVVAYGTPADNPVVEHFLRRFGVVVEPERISIDSQSYEGDGLVLIITQAHPDHPAQPVLLYTATQDASMDGINNVDHGSTDWVVARNGPNGLEEVDSGFFSGLPPVPSPVDEAQEASPPQQDTP